MKKRHIHILITTLILLIAVPLNALAYNEHKDISYVEGSEDHKHKLDIYTPYPRLPQRPAIEGVELSPNAYTDPVHIFVHGGGWTMGDKKTVNRDKATAYTNENIIVVSVNYRLAPDHPFPAQIEDLAKAIDWIYKNIGQYNGDINRMIISGHSAGGHLIALLGTDPSYLKKYGLSPDIFKGIYPIDSASLDLTEPSEGKGARMVEFMKWRTFGKNPETRKKASPYHNIESGRAYPPFRLYVTAERPEAVTKTKDFVDKLKAHSHDAALITIDRGLSHADMKDAIFETKSEIFKDITAKLKD